MNNRTFYTIKQNIGTQIGDSSAAMLTLIGGFVNDRLLEVYRRCNLVDINRADYQFDTVASTSDYVLPSDFGKDISVADITNNLRLARIDLQEFVYFDYAQLYSTGVVNGYVIMDKTVRAQPSSASALAVVSDAAGDTTQTVYIKGLDSNANATFEEISLNGTTPANSTNTYSRIDLISKSATTAGAITITSNSAAVTVAVMSREMLEHRVKIMRMFLTPNSVLTISINYIQLLLPMSQTYDYPIIDCADVLEAGGSADAWRFKRQFGKAADLDVIFEKRLANLIFDYESQPNKIQTFKPRTYSYREYDGNVDDSRRYGVF